jgi:hypothetical protein
MAGKTYTELRPATCQRLKRDDGLGLVMPVTKQAYFLMHRRRYGPESAQVDKYSSPTRRAPSSKFSITIHEGPQGSRCPGCMIC